MFESTDSIAASPYSPEELEKRRNVARSQFERGTKGAGQNLVESFVASGRGTAGGDLLKAQADQEQTLAGKWNEISGSMDSENAAGLADERQKDIQRQFQNEQRLGAEQFATSERLGEQDFRTAAAQKQYEYERSLTQLRSSLAEQLAKDEADRRRSDLIESMMGEAGGNILGSWLSKP